MFQLSGDTGIKAKCQFSYTERYFPEKGAAAPSLHQTGRHRAGEQNGAARARLRGSWARDGLERAERRAPALPPNKGVPDGLQPPHRAATEPAVPLPCPVPEPPAGWGSKGPLTPCPCSAAHDGWWEDQSPSQKQPGSHAGGAQATLG